MSYDEKLERELRMNLLIEAQFSKDKPALPDYEENPNAKSKLPRK
jgi:hypothetical protein